MKFTHSFKIDFPTAALTSEVTTRSLSFTSLSFDEGLLCCCYKVRQEEEEGGGRGKRPNSSTTLALGWTRATPKPKLELGGRGSEDMSDAERLLYGGRDIQPADRLS